MKKYKSHVAVSKTTHFLSVFCEAGVVQQCTEAQKCDPRWLILLCPENMVKVTESGKNR